MSDLMKSDGANRGWFKPRRYVSLRDVRLNVAIVHHALERGLSLEQVVVELANERERLIAEVMRLDAIAPKKIRTAKGVMIWRCPDDLVPA